jgi:hypothetical protein
LRKELVPNAKGEDESEEAVVDALKLTDSRERD